MKKDHRTYFLKVLKNNKEVSRVRTKSLRRFLHLCRLIQFTDLRVDKVSIRVTYGLKENHLGKLENFDNSGDYYTIKNLMQAAKAFTEEV